MTPPASASPVVGIMVLQIEACLMPYLDPGDSFASVCMSDLTISCSSLVH